MHSSELLSRQLTRRLMVEWSAFTLPKSALAHLPASVLADIAGKDPLRVPGLSYEQLRTLERHHLYDDWRQAEERQRRRLLTVWRPTRRGDTRLYSVHHLFLSRLAAWLLHWGLTMQETITVLRQHETAITMLAPGAESVVVARHPRTVIGTVCDTRAEQWWRDEVASYPSTHTAPQFWIFKLAYLGVRRTLPKLRKELARRPLVHRWRQEWEPAALVAKQTTELSELRA